MAPSAVLAWVVVQIAVLAVALLQVPLAAYRPPGSTLMPEILLAGQVGASALLAPLLMRTPATLLIIVLSSWPPLLLACGLSTRPAASTALAGSVLTGWLLCLFFWVTSFHTAAAKQVVSTGAAILSVGAAVVSYLGIEFRSGEEQETVETALNCTPMLLSWSNAGDVRPSLSFMLPLGLVVLTGAAIWLARIRYRRSAWV